MVITNKTRRWNRYSSYNILRSSRSKPPNVDVDILVSFWMFFFRLFFLSYFYTCFVSFKTNNKVKEFQKFWCFFTDCNSKWDFFSFQCLLLLLKQLFCSLTFLCDGCNWLANFKFSIFFMLTLMLMFINMYAIAFSSFLFVCLFVGCWIFFFYAISSI